MKRIIPHWTAGASFPTSFDLKHYHWITDVDGKHHKGVDIALNQGSLKNGYAEHTRNLNTDSIGTSMAGMGRAVERPFDPGPWPLQEKQFEAHCQKIAELADEFDIPVTRKTILSHAEVEPTLGVKQSGKWDISRLPFKPELIGALIVGDYMRQRVSFYLGKPVAEPRDPVPAGAIAEVATNGSNLYIRNRPEGPIVGSLPNRTRVTVLALAGDDWYHVQAPNGATGYISADFAKIVDGPPASEPTQPDPRRVAIATMRQALDALEESL